MSLFDSGVRPIVDNFLIEESKKLRDYGEFWSASSAGYCMRKNIFERMGVPHIESEDAARKQRLFTAGHVFHSWLQDLTKQAGVSIAQEVELIDNDLMIKGHFDDLILTQLDESGEPVTVGSEPRGRHLILYDYKTVNSRSFIWAKKNGNAMSLYHRMQLGTYMYIIRTLQKEAVKPEWLDSLPLLTEARILKIEKENLMMMEQQLMWSPDLEKEVVGYWRTLNGYWKNKKLPKCTCADVEGGFMSSPKYNPYYFNGEPCSIEWYELWKKEQEGKK